jgi:hypothetical protein
MTFAGQERGVQVQMMKAAPHDIYPGSVVYGRHHSNYIRGVVRCVIRGTGLVAVQFPLSAPNAPASVPADQLFVKVD